MMLNCYKSECELPENVTLKVCPFCGSTGLVYCFQGTALDGNATYYTVTCNNMSCLVNNHYYTTLEEAIEKWNARVDSPVLSTESSPTNISPMQKSAYRVFKCCKQLLQYLGKIKTKPEEKDLALSEADVEIICYFIKALEQAEAEYRG